MDMIVVRRIGISSLAKFQGFIMAVMTAIFGVPWIFLASMAGGPEIIIAYPVMIIFGAASGAVIGALNALMYNVVSSIIGGVKLDMDQI